MKVWGRPVSPYFTYEAICSATPTIRAENAYTASESAAFVSPAASSAAEIKRRTMKAMTKGDPQFVLK